MLVLIAKGISDRSSKLSEALAQGLELIQQMSIGQGKASSETRVIVALQRAIIRLHNRPVPTLGTDDTLGKDLPVEHLKEWELLWKQKSPEYTSDNHVSGSQSDNLDQREDLNTTLGAPFLDKPITIENDACDMWNAIFNTQLEEFSLFPQGEENIELGVEGIEW